MATGATGQLGLALPVQGELSGTWGDTVNNGITQYTNIAIAGTLTLTNDGAVTLANTTGDASASNITSTLTGAGTVTAQFAIVRVTGTLTTAKVVTAPSYSKTYTVVNAATGGIVTFKASGQTGVSIAVGETAFVYFNGTDYVKVVGTATAGAAGGSNTQVQFNSSGILAGSANMTFNGTGLTLANDASISGLTVGRGAGAVATNTAVGASALAANTSGQLIVAVGTNSLAANTSGAGGTAIGRDALKANTTGDWNIGIGTDALLVNTAGSNNIGIGQNALAANITTSNNVAVGFQSLYLNTESSNTAVGYQAGYNNAGGDYLTVVGYQAGKGNTSGRFNTAVGRDALLTNSTSNDNTAVGTNALKLATVGGNTAVGSNALGVNSTGASNIGVGNGALTRNTTGSNNVGVGVDTLSFNVAASENTSVGYQAGYSIASGAGNVTVGFSAGYNITSSYNTAIGRYAMGGTGDKSGGGFNTAIGNGAGEELTTGDKNTFVGWACGYKITTGAKNTIIGGYSGNQGGLDIRTASNYIVLSDGDGNPRGVFDGSGNLGIGTTSPSYRLDVFQSGSVNVFQVQGNATDGSVLARYYQSANSGDNGFIAFLTETAPTARGTITYNRAGGLVAYNTTSDYRAKDIYGPVTNSGSLIDSVPVYMGKMKGATQERPMFIAHEVPAYAHTGEKDAVDKDGKPVYQQMDASALIPVMWAELQSLRARVAQLESKP